MTNSTRDAARKNRNAAAGVFVMARSHASDVFPRFARRGNNVLVVWEELGERLLAQVLTECHQAGRTFPFVALVLDCIDENAKQFYLRWDFREIPGRPMRFYLSAQALDAMVAGQAAAESWADRESHGR
jgi:hypothetical protein